MIREFHLADWFTLTNATCGMGALFSMLTYLQTTDVKHVTLACGMVFAGSLMVSRIRFLIIERERPSSNHLLDRPKNRRSALWR